MNTLVDHLSQYASYHRDSRNILTHFVGIPLIVLAVAVLLSRPGWNISGLWISPATLLPWARRCFTCGWTKRWAR
ncbi:PRS2-like protein [Pseudomonas syringae pv. persicae]|uniref:PRS2-like protein n=1 Tax=Pseudomonas syringae pv. persicae TaxID=237306 RepID=A0AB38EKT4_9PSED|nr:PRS2-like protein [Pseudomonas syringae pv. persicae]SOQ14649.1 PRS2-like protein [Pseudomonas syringae pv. persicae]